MNPMPESSTELRDDYRPGCPLEDVLATHLLAIRPPRSADLRAENEALISLSSAFSNTPENVLEQLVQHGAKLCNAHSCGVSLEDLSLNPPVFRWVAVAGQMSRFAGGTMPRHFSPCTETVKRKEVVLIRNIVRHYPYARQLGLDLVEALLVPFTVDRETVGTVWLLSHDTSRQFDRQDARVISMLANFAGAAVAATRKSQELAAMTARLRQLSGSA
jgi:GAF domain-containing protein